MGKNLSLSDVKFRPTPSTNQPADQWGLSAIFPEVTKPRPEIRSTYSYTSIPKHVFMAWTSSTGETLQIYSHCNRRIFILHHIFCKDIDIKTKNYGSDGPGFESRVDEGIFLLSKTVHIHFLGPNSLVAAGYQGLLPVDTAA